MIMKRLKNQSLLLELEDYVLGFLAKEREQRSGRKDYLSLAELEQRVGLRDQHAR